MTQTIQKPAAYPERVRERLQVMRNELVQYQAAFGVVSDDERRTAIQNAELCQFLVPATAIGDAAMAVESTLSEVVEYLEDVATKLLDYVEACKEADDVEEEADRLSRLDPVMQSRARHDALRHEEAA